MQILCLYSQTGKVIRQSDEHPGQTELKRRQVMNEKEHRVILLKVKTWEKF